LKKQLVAKFLESFGVQNETGIPLLNSAEAET